MTIINNASTNNVPAEFTIVRPERRNLVIDGSLQVSASADPKANFSNAEMSFAWQATLELAKAGDINAAELLAEEITKRLINVSDRADAKIIEVLKNGGAKNDKAAAKLRKERMFRLAQLELLKGQHDQSGHNVNGLIDEMRALKAANLSTVLDPEAWFHLEDQRIDKEVVIGRLNWNSLIRLLNKGGAQKFIEVSGNVIIRPVVTGFDFAFSKDGKVEHVVLNGETTHSILMQMLEQQSIPYTQLGVLPSDGLPNFDGKSGIGRMDWITGDPADAETPVRFFCQDTLHGIMVRALLYAYDELMYSKYEFENGQLRRFMGSNMFVALNSLDCDYFMIRLTLEVNKKSPSRLKGMLNGYLKDVASEVSQLFVTNKDGQEEFVYDNYKLTRLANVDGYYDLMEEVLKRKAAEAAAKAAKTPAASGAAQSYQKHAKPALGGLNVTKPGSRPSVEANVYEDDELEG